MQNSLFPQTFLPVHLLEYSQKSNVQNKYRFLCDWIFAEYRGFYLALGRMLPFAVATAKVPVEPPPAQSSWERSPLEQKMSRTLVDSFMGPILQARLYTRSGAIADATLVILGRAATHRKFSLGSLSYTLNSLSLESSPESGRHKGKAGQIFFHLKVGGGKRETKFLPKFLFLFWMKIFPS